MKQYVIDELRIEDYEKIRTYLDEHLGPCGIDGIYWLPLDSSILNKTQAEHSECRPFYFVIELEPARLSCELLVRTKNTVRCSCMAYATKKQRNWLIELIDTIFSRLEIKT